jgi:stage II sporulation protein AA (anti-sigma F factor antagonist)
MAGSADGKGLSTPTRKVRALGAPVWRLSNRTVAENGTIVLILEGRLGHATAPQLKAIVEGAAQDSKDVVLDLAGIDYLSSAALKVIDGLAADQAGRGGELTLRSPSPAARLSLELSGMNGMLR